MPLVVLSRRNMTYRETGRGEVTVLLVPGRDQIQVVKDLAGMNSAPGAKTTLDAGIKSASATSKKQVQLSRVHIGKRYIYGALPNEISDMRQPVKVWLAEDFAPPQSQAFFFIFNKNVVVHGVREQDDEGFQNWRTAQLTVDEADPLRSIINAISDYALANSTETLTVAVLNKLDLYEQLQAGLATYNINPVPFSKLRPLPILKPLYRHRDYTILYLTLCLFGLILLIASGSYLALNWMKRNELDATVQRIQSDIDSIKRNQNIGQIADPQAILQMMGRAINQQPSAILDAVGNAAAAMGKLSAVKAVLGSGSGNAGLMAIPAPEGQLNVEATIETMNEDMLLTQEQAAARTLATRPWVREIRRTGQVGTRGDLIITVQVDEVPGVTVPATPIENEAAPINPQGGAQ